MTALTWQYDDGGRSEAPGFGGKSGTGDCVPRAIAIATRLPYEEVYAELARRQYVFSTGRSRAAKKARGKAPRQGVARAVHKQYLADLGWTWVPTMSIGSGTRVHLRDGELPARLGPLVVAVSRHLCAVVDNVICDTHDPSRDGTRAVYGYWHQSVYIEGVEA